MYRKTFGNRNGYIKRNRFNNYKSKKTINVESFIKQIENEPVKEAQVVTTKYSDFNISAQLKDNILTKGFNTPTPVQDQAIPHILKGKDLIGLANTGTGKTAAYLIPLIEKVIQNKKEVVLVMAPTRELASQINAEFYSLRKGLNIYSVLVTGGANINRQISDLKREYNFLIVTPGRLKDLVKRKYIDLSKINTLVLDEVDRMFDMGFIKDIKYLISLMSKKRQSLFFSATFSNSVASLIKENSNNAVTVNVVNKTTSTNVSQQIIKYMSDQGKVEILHDLLIKEDCKKVLIFGKTKVGVGELSKELRYRGFSVEEIHGNKKQAARNRSLKLFKENSVNILVATDVASRGIDVNDITHVINYDLPDTFEDYIHRIGRTGRANKKGLAISFVKSNN